MLELVLDEYLRDLDGGRLHGVLDRLVSRLIARLVEGGVCELVAYRLSERRDVGDPDGLGELVVERRKDLFGDLRGPDAERPGLAGELVLTRVVRECEVHLLFVAHLHADERLTQTRDAEILPCLDVRVTRERR